MADAKKSAMLMPMRTLAIDQKGSPQLNDGVPLQPGSQAELKRQPCIEPALG